jgi:hypothetical protein
MPVDLRSGEFEYANQRWDKANGFLLSGLRLCLGLNRCWGWVERRLGKQRLPSPIRFKFPEQ